MPLLAGQWDHSSSLLGGLVTIAVHEMHCREFDRAAARAEAVAGFYGLLSDLFAAAMPEVFPDRVRSSLRGKALGTALQARLGRGLTDAAAAAAARGLSDEALIEFDSKVGRRRQHQYRAFLETICGDFAAARTHLGLALDTNSDHAAMGDAVARLPVGQQGFCCCIGCASAPRPRLPAMQPKPRLSAPRSIGATGAATAGAGRDSTARRAG